MALATVCVIGAGSSGIAAAKALHVRGFDFENITRLRGDTVEFADAGEEPADIIVYCTGYTVTFPFFDAAVVAPDNELPLYRRVFHPDDDGLYFIACCSRWARRCRSPRRSPSGCAAASRAGTRCRRERRRGRKRAAGRMSGSRTA